MFEATHGAAWASDEPGKNFRIDDSSTGSYSPSGANYNCDLIFVCAAGVIQSEASRCGARQYPRALPKHQRSG